MAEKNTSDTQRNETGSSPKKSATKKPINNKSAGGSGSKYAGNKKPSAKKMTKKEEFQAEQRNREILGLMFFVLGLFFLFANFPFTGKIGRAISSISYGATGLFGNIFPIVLIVLGIYLVFSSNNNELLFKILLASGMLVCICSLMHIKRATESIATEINFTSYVSDAYKYGVNNRYGGGVLGSILTYFTMKSIGIVGSYLIFIFSGIALLIALTNISLKSAGEKVGSTIKHSLDNYIEKQTVKREEKTIQKVERIAKEERIEEERRKVFNFAEIEMNEAKRNMQYQTPPKDLPPVIDRNKKSEFDQYNLTMGDNTRDDSQDVVVKRVSRVEETSEYNNKFDSEQDPSFAGKLFGTPKVDRQSDYFEEEYTFVDSEIDYSIYDEENDENLYNYEDSYVEQNEQDEQNYDPHYDKFLPPKTNTAKSKKAGFNYDDGLGEFYEQVPKDDEIDLFAPESKAEEIEYDNYDVLAKGGNVVQFPFGYRKPRPESFANLVFDQENENAEYVEHEDESIYVEPDDCFEVDDDILVQEVVKPKTRPVIKNVKPQVSKYTLPPLSLLSSPPNKPVYTDDFKQKATVLMSTMESFGVKGTILGYFPGPTITRFEIQLAPGVRINRLTNISNDIAMNLAVPDIRIAPIPGKAALGIEIPNKSTQPVVLREMLESNELKTRKSNISVPLGKDIGGKTVVCDIGKMPHLLIAGSTGSGKSVCINTIICSLIFNSTPEQVKLILVDPKVVELANFKKIPHLLIPVVTNPKKASSALARAVLMMEQRYQDFAEVGARDLARYNKIMLERGEIAEPQLVIIIDELADLMMVAPDEVEDAICRLAQMGRAAGIHLIVATQRPSSDIITGLIKANIPSRIAFAVASGTDSRIILDSSGAEKLLGKGDMLYMPLGVSQAIRLQGAFVSDKEIEKIIKYIDDSGNTYQSFDNAFETDIENVIANKLSTSLDDEDEGLLPDIVEALMQNGSASTSMIQRRFRIGYNRAARIMDSLEDRGIITSADGSNRARDILISREDFEALFGREPQIPPLGT